MSSKGAGLLRVRSFLPGTREVSGSPLRDQTIPTNIMSAERTYSKQKEISPLRSSTGMFGKMDDPTFSRTRISGKTSPLRGQRTITV